MVVLFLIRHGETLENAERILQGHLPGHLSAVGIRQAMEKQKEIADMQVDVVVSSDLGRAVDTARILTQNLCVEVITNNLLRERDWGKYTGKCTLDVNTKSPDFFSSVESDEALQKRACHFLAWLWENFQGKKVLAVGHGYFNRCIVAAHMGLTPHDIPRWGNLEIRTLRINTHPKFAFMDFSHFGEVSAD